MQVEFPVTGTLVHPQKDLLLPPPCSAPSAWPRLGGILRGSPLHRHSSPLYPSWQTKHDSPLTSPLPSPLFISSLSPSPTAPFPYIHPSSSSIQSPLVHLLTDAHRCPLLPSPPHIFRFQWPYSSSPAHAEEAVWVERMAAE